MSVGGLTFDPVTKTPIVVLKNDAESLNLPIWIGLLEATSMATQLEGIKMPRPMTHDLLSNVLSELGASVIAIEVTALKDNTFYAAIQITIGDKEMLIDSRPSDAISLALRTDSPIFVAREVLESSSVPSETDEDVTRVQADASKLGKDISDLAPEQWNDVLENLSADDAKYKM